MSTGRRASFKQDDVTRAVRGVLRAGVQLAGVVISPNGVISLTVAADGNLPDETDDLDDRIDRFAAR